MTAWPPYQSYQQNIKKGGAKWRKVDNLFLF
jgi:hypothetical protein